MQLRLICKLLIVVVAFSFVSVINAQADHPAEAQEVEEVLPDAGLTPASPLHVFERFGDWVRLNVLTFNAVRKAEIKIEISEKRLAELKSVVESGSSETVVSRAEALVDSSAQSLQGDADRLNLQGRDASALIEKLNGLSLKQQAVLEDVLERAPEQARVALARAIENSQKGLVKAEETLKKQVEKGLIKEEKAKEIFERTLERLKAQVERRGEHLDELAEELGEVPPEAKERFEAKLKHFEDRLVNVESKEEFKEIREELKDRVKDSASTVLELRARHKLSDDVGDEFLRDIERDRFDVAKKVAEAVREAEKELAGLKAKIARAESAGKNIPKNVMELMSNAEKHLANAKSAFENKNFGEAFGQANAARHNVKSAERFLEHVLEGKDKAQKAIEEAKEEIRDFEAEIEEVKTETGQVPEEALKILEAAKSQLRQAEAAFAEGNLEPAFRHAESAERMADRGKDLLDKKENVFEKRPEAEKKVLEREEKVLKKTLEVERKLEERKIEASPVEVKSIEVKPAETRTADRVLRAEVIMTDEGFSPKEVKIQKGGTIVWVNKGSVAMWPASAIHPTHAAYPQKGGCVGSAFDACKRIESGGTYEFRFDHVGSWKYHDHINTSHFGAVTVVE